MIQDKFLGLYDRIYLSITTVTFFWENWYHKKAQYISRCISIEKIIHLRINKKFFPGSEYRDLPSLYKWQFIMLIPKNNDTIYILGIYMLQSTYMLRLLHSF